MQKRLITVACVLLKFAFVASHLNAQQTATKTISVVDRSPAHIRIEWSSFPQPQSRYRIYRRTAGGTWRIAGETSQSRFDDGGLQAESTYEYKVTSVDNGNDKVVGLSEGATTSAWSCHIKPQIIVAASVDHYPASPTAVAGNDGDLVVVYQRGETKQRRRWWNSSLWMTRSRRADTAGDEFDWSKPRMVFSGTRKEGFAKPALVRLGQNELGLSYSRFELDVEGRIVSRQRLFVRSTDEGATWSDPVMMGRQSSNNDSLIEAADGRLLQALSSYTPAVDIAASDDRGYSWRTLSNVIAKPHARPTGEADLVHLGAGRIVFLSRHESPFYCLQLSDDNGVSWSGPRTLWLGGGDNPPKILRLPNSRTLVAVVHSWRPAGKAKDRRQLASLVSHDGGVTWGNFRLIGFFPDGTDGFLQHSVTFVGDVAYLLYGGGSRHDTADGDDLRVIRLHKNFFTSTQAWPYDWQGKKAIE